MTCGDSPLHKVCSPSTLIFLSPIFLSTSFADEPASWKRKSLW